MEHCSITNESIFERVIPKLIINEDVKTIEQKLLNHIKNDVNNFVEFYCFCDTFKRNSSMFKKVTKVHVKLLKEKTYTEAYSYLCKIGKEHGNKCIEMYFPKMHKIYGKFIHENRKLYFSDVAERVDALVSKTSSLIKSEGSSPFVATK